MAKKKLTVAELQELVENKDKEIARLERKLLLKSAKFESMHNTFEAERNKLKGTIMILKRYLVEQLKRPITTFKDLAEADEFVDELSK